MSYKRVYIASAAALAIGLAGTVFAGPPVSEGEDAPASKEIKAPVSDPAAQAKTEQMLKEEAKTLTTDAPVSSEVKAPVPDAQAQEKTEEEVEQLDRAESSD